MRCSAWPGASGYITCYHIIHCVLTSAFYLHSFHGCHDGARYAWYKLSLPLSTVLRRQKKGLRSKAIRNARESFVKDTVAVRLTATGNDGGSLEGTSGLYSVLGKRVACGVCWDGHVCLSVPRCVSTNSASLQASLFTRLPPSLLPTLPSSDPFPLLYPFLPSACPSRLSFSSASANSLQLVREGRVDGRHLPPALPNLLLGGRKEEKIFGSFFFSEG